MVVAWIAYPLVLAALGAGWGVLVQKLARTELNAALTIPVGLAAVIVVAGTCTAIGPLVRVAVPACAVGALVGLAWGRPWQRFERWPLLAAIGVVLAYGAPVLLSGHATFLGYLRLDDTATWFDLTDNLFAHGHSVAGLPPSTYRLDFMNYVGKSYPIGAFMIFGVGRALLRTDLAWVFDPYLACCTAAIALCIYVFAEPFVASPRRRALIAFLGAQPALLYGYYLWGGIKEVTAAFLLALATTLAAHALERRPRGVQLLPLALATGALITTISVAAAAWIVPGLVILLARWSWVARSTDARLRFRSVRSSAEAVGWLTAMAALCAIPSWIALRGFLAGDGYLFISGESAAPQHGLGNLLKPLSTFQLAGIWTVGDFRITAPLFPTAPLIAIVLAAAIAGVLYTVRRREFGLLLFAAVALCAIGILVLLDSSPWAMGKALAISSTALLTVALIAATMLWNHRRWGALVLAALTFGVCWSNLLGYHDALLAPAGRMSELAHIGKLVAGKGPTFINDYEIYADRHFLRDGAPVEPAEYRSVDLPTARGILLVKFAYADLDSFSVATLLPYRSIVIRDSPVESRPLSIYRLVWQGRYYALYQRPAHPATRIVTHFPLGDQARYPYCGNAEHGPSLPVCSIVPAAVPSCSLVRELGSEARNVGGRLVAYERPNPIVASADQMVWPAAWHHDAAAHTLTPNTPGTAVAHISVTVARTFELWLGGSFARGFEVSVDGRSVGHVTNQIFDIDGYAPVAKLRLTAGVHTIDLTYPQPDIWLPGTGDNHNTMLSAIVLQPLHSPPTRMLTVAPSNASALCGRSLDWLEVVAPDRGR
jgi:hypothetical protein